MSWISRDIAFSLLRNIKNMKDFYMMGSISKGYRKAIKNNGVFYNLLRSHFKIFRILQFYGINTKEDESKLPEYIYCLIYGKTIVTKPNLSLSDFRLCDNGILYHVSKTIRIFPFIGVQNMQQYGNNVYVQLKNYDGKTHIFRINEDKMSLLHELCEIFGFDNQNTDNSDDDVHSEDEENAIDQIEEIYIPIVMPPENILREDFKEDFNKLVKETNKDINPQTHPELYVFIPGIGHLINKGAYFNFMHFQKDNKGDKDYRKTNEHKYFDESKRKTKLEMLIDFDKSINMSEEHMLKIYSLNMIKDIIKYRQLDIFHPNNLKLLYRYFTANNVINLYVHPLNGYVAHKKLIGKLDPNMKYLLTKCKAKYDIFKLPAEKMNDELYTEIGCIPTEFVAKQIKTAYDVTFCVTKDYKLYLLRGDKFEQIKISDAVIQPTICKDIQLAKNEIVCSMSGDNDYARIFKCSYEYVLENGCLDFSNEITSDTDINDLMEGQWEFNGNTLKEYEAICEDQIDSLKENIKLMMSIGRKQTYEGDKIGFDNKKIAANMFKFLDEEENYNDKIINFENAKKKIRQIFGNYEFIRNHRQLLQQCGIDVSIDALTRREDVFFMDGYVTEEEFLANEKKGENFIEDVGNDVAEQALAIYKKLLPSKGLIENNNNSNNNNFTDAVQNLKTYNESDIESAENSDYDIKEIIDAEFQRYIDDQSNNQSDDQENDLEEVFGGYY